MGRFRCRHPGLLALTLSGFLLVLTGCEQKRASREDCAEILDRIVDIELRERGFRDPALARRKGEDLRRRFSSELAACEGRLLLPEAMTCIRHATTTEEISHQCLR